MSEITTADLLDLKTVRAMCERVAAYHDVTILRLMSRWVSEMEPSLLISAKDGAIIGLGVAGDLSLYPQAYVTVHDLFA